MMGNAKQQWQEQVIEQNHSLYNQEAKASKRG
jgi:hypothetical protein